MELSRWRKAGAGCFGGHPDRARGRRLLRYAQARERARARRPQQPGDARLGARFRRQRRRHRLLHDRQRRSVAGSQQTLANQARWLQQYSQYTITIEGHADERGTREYNIALGAKRAQAVRNFLAQHGINAARIRTISYGKERPVAVCNDISCWSQNRRAQTVLNSRHEARS